MKITMICRVIDNFGDAGVSLRLGRGLVAQSKHCVDIWTDQPEVYRHLLSTDERDVFDVHAQPLRILPLRDLRAEAVGSVVIEAFGSELPEETAFEFDQATQQEGRVQPRWLVLDYLSAEPWVEEFHLKPSINPRGGVQKTYFYPGFTSRTGGLIHEDWRAADKPTAKRATNESRRVFIFAYQSAPLGQLASALSHEALYVAHPQGQASAVAATIDLHTNIQGIEFVPQTAFDELLMGFDWLFVRGEDSIVRAQLSGKPFVWHIYPTEDQQHWIKLKSFFSMYSLGLDQTIADALWQLWSLWNTPDSNSADLQQAWTRVIAHEGVISTHNRGWAERLRSQKSLVSQLLTWIHP